MCCIRNKSEKRLLKHPVSLLKIKEEKLKRRTKKTRKATKKKNKRKEKKIETFVLGLGCLACKKMIWNYLSFLSTLKFLYNSFGQLFWTIITLLFDAIILKFLENFNQNAKKPVSSQLL